MKRAKTEMNFGKTTAPISLLVILLLSQWACRTLLPSAPQTSIPSPVSQAVTVVPTSAGEVSTLPVETPVVLSDEEIMAGIQESLNKYAEAYTYNQPEVLSQIVDAENKPFYRIVTSRFKTFQESYLAGQIEFSYTVTEIQRRDYGYVVAHIVTPGMNADWVFRQLNGVWVLSEPSVEQVGEAVETETDHFVFITYPWADDVNPRIMEMMETARGDVEKVLGKTPEQKAKVKIMPIYGLSPYNAMDAIALYASGRETIEVYTPFSYAFGGYDPALGWDGELQATLTHEYTHMTHMRSFDMAGRLSDWMSEGLAEYVSATTDENIYYACDAMRGGTFIPIIDESDAVYKQDLMHLTMLDENVWLGYEYSHSLVKFTADNYGGMDGFWKLARALDETSDFKKAVPEAFGIPYEQYERQWREWLKRQC